MKNKYYHLHYWNRLLFFALSLVFVSCATSKRNFNFNSEVLESQEGEALTQNQDTSYDYSEPIIEWWKTFNDPILDSLIILAKENNKDIGTALANYNAAKAIYRNRKIDRLPAVFVNGGYTRTRLGENIFVPGLNPTYNQYDGFFSTSWELDFFGRASNRAKNAFASQQASLATLQDSYLMITAEVAKTYIDLLGTRYRWQIASQNLNDQQNAYDLTRSLTDVGTGNELDVSRASSQLQSTQAIVFQLSARLDAIENRLATLLGISKNALEIPLGSGLPVFPGVVPKGDLYILLRNRPDVFEAESRVRMQIAQYNIAVADLYPKITFNGNVGFSAIDIGNFGSRQSFTWSLIPSLSWAGLNLGRVKQNIKKEDALTIAAITQYEQIVLEAVEEIRTNWSALYYELLRQEALAISSKDAESAALLAQERYSAGIDDFFNYLIANETRLSIEDQLAQSNIQVLNFYINLYKSFGNGWENITSEDMQNRYEQLQLKNADKN